MGVEVSRLSNGLVVATETMPHLESVTLGVWIKSGSRNERDDEHLRGSPPLERRQKISHVCRSRIRKMPNERRNVEHSQRR